MDLSKKTIPELRKLFGQISHELQRRGVEGRNLDFQREWPRTKMLQKEHDRLCRVVTVAGDDGKRYKLAWIDGITVSVERIGSHVIQPRLPANVKDLRDKLNARIEKFDDMVCKKFPDRLVQEDFYCALMELDSYDKMLKEWRSDSTS